MRRRVRTIDTLKINDSGINYHNSFGIYRIINTVTGRFYIGKTATSFETRWLQHAHDMDRGAGNKEMSMDWKTYGKENFLFEIIEVLLDSKILCEIERYWIDKFDNLYNRDARYRRVENDWGKK